MQCAVLGGGGTHLHPRLGEVAEILNRQGPLLNLRDTRQGRRQRVGERSASNASRPAPAMPRCLKAVRTAIAELGAGVVEPEYQEPLSAVQAGRFDTHLSITSGQQCALDVRRPANKLITFGNARWVQVDPKGEVKGGPSRDGVV
jgi:hypothetical protein